MSVITSEIVLRKSATYTDSPTNGGRMSKVAITDNASQSMMPNWSATQMSSGATRYRKLFVHNVNDDDLTLADARIHLLSPTPAADRLTLFAGTQTDTQFAISSPTEYGAGTLQVAAAAGATCLTVSLEDDSQTIFRTSDTIFLATLSSTEDNDEHRTVTQSEYHENVTVSQSGSVVTITLADGDMLTAAYAAGDTVASVLPLGDIVAAIGAVSKVTSAGTLDTTAVTSDNIGSINQTVTLTFTSATAFTAVSDVKGSLGTGSISSAFAPSNSDFTKPYLTIATSAWGGTWAAGETVTIPITPAAAAFWLKNVVEAGAASYGIDLGDLQISGGSN